MSGMIKEIILKEVVHDNGRVINNGPREVGTNKKDKIGVQHKDGPLVHLIEILDLNLNGEISRHPVNVIKTGVNNHKPHRVGWQDPQQGHQAQQQQATAAQYWPTAATATQQQQQLPTLPAPVYPPGMQPTNVQPPPGLGHTSVQQTWQGGTTQNAPIQFGSAATRQQSPFGSQPTQDQLQTGNNRLLVSSHNSLLGEVHLIKDTSSHSIHFTEGECSDTV